MKIVKQFQPKIVIFTAVKNCCMLHGHVFVMFFQHANNKGADQTVHLLRLIGAIVVPKMNNMMNF